LYRYTKMFEQIIGENEVVAVSSANIHALTYQCINQTPYNYVAIMQAKFHALFKLYYNYFVEHPSMDETLLKKMTDEISSDALIIRYAYYTKNYSSTS
jgi:hypothetical protein